MYIDLYIEEIRGSRVFGRIPLELDVPEYSRDLGILKCALGCLVLAVSSAVHENRISLVSADRLSLLLYKENKAFFGLYGRPGTPLQTNSSDTTPEILFYGGRYVHNH